jgi:cation transporter-like permease
MKLLMDILLLATSILTFLGLVHVVGRMRGARLRTRGALGDGQYQAERDLGVRAAILVVGLLLGAVLYIVSRAFGQGF